jgi:hypothetical protein
MFSVVYYSSEVKVGSKLGKQGEVMILFCREAVEGKGDLLC